MEDAFGTAIDNFAKHINEMLSKRWDAWAHDHEDRQLHEVVGALLGRQVTLATELARNPGCWNAHVAPLLLRPMVEGLITMAWILEDPSDRARGFVLYGLGQEKLLLEHEKSMLVERGIDPATDQDVQDWENWLNGERRTELIEVNVGEWAGMNLRAMAEEANCLDLHKIDYARWSGTTHNMWHHLVRFNLRNCDNPLHGFHRIPSTPQLPPNPDYLQWSAEYLDLAFGVFDEKTGVDLKVLTATEVLDRELQLIPWPEGPDEGDSARPPNTAQ